MPEYIIPPILLCRVCGERRAADCFHKHRGQPLGYSTKCKRCRRADFLARLGTRACDYCGKIITRPRDTLKKPRVFCDKRCAAGPSRKGTPEHFRSLDNGDGGCWEWDGWRNRGGYGQVTHEGRRVLAHRLAYELFVGPIPDGLQLDHLCRNRCCVNPAHLEPVTCAENLRRGEHPKQVIHRSGACAKGHPRTPENVYIWHDKRMCRICRRQRQKDAGRRRPDRERSEKKNESYHPSFRFE